MTTTIGLIATGQCEHLALAASLQRVFADHDVQFTMMYASPADSITSGFVSYPAPVRPVGVKTVAERLVDRMAAAFESRTRPAFVFAVDDLELDNIAPPGNVTGVVRDAVLGVLGKSPTHAHVAWFRGRCSLHLLCPMLETYFYGEPAALVRAGARRNAIIAQNELEDFESGDVAYLTPANEPRHAWRSADRARHPKRYLRFLTQEDYRETRGGKDALAQLDWHQVFAHKPPGLAFAHALFHDLSDALAVPCPFQGAAHPETARRANGVLRNL